MTLKQDKSKKKQTLMHVLGAEARREARREMQARLTRIRRVNHMHFRLLRYMELYAKYIEARKDEEPTGARAAAIILVGTGAWRELDMFPKSFKEDFLRAERAMHRLTGEIFKIHDAVLQERRDLKRAP